MRSVLLLIMAPTCAALVLLGLSGRQQRHTDRFDQLLSAVSLGEEALACVDDVRLRHVLVGIAAVDESPPVRGAFQILFTDLPPVRFAADLLFPIIEPVTSEARASSDSLVSIPEAELRAARLLFDAMERGTEDNVTVLVVLFD